MAFSQRRTVPGFNVETFHLSAHEVADRKVTLKKTPEAPDAVIMLVADSGGHYLSGQDFSVSGRDVSWSGQWLETMFGTEDRISVIFS